MIFMARQPLLLSLTLQGLVYVNYVFGSQGLLNVRKRESPVLKSAFQVG